MNTFSDFTFYRDEYHGRLSESDYNSAVRDAYMEIISQTSGRAKTAPLSMMEAVKLCECELVDLIFTQKKGSSMLPSGIASISNDGYSVSAGNIGRAETIKSEMRERHTICARYLQCPENLMCRWI